MVDIIVRRHGGLRPGADIVEPLIGGNEAVAVMRGRNELDERAQAFTPINLRVVARTGLLPGQLAEVNDSDQGRSYRAKIKSVRLVHTTDGDGAETSRCELAVEKISEFQ